MNRLLIVVVILAIIVSLVLNFWPSKELEARPKMQYTKPIGPTQEEPYYLKSQVYGGIPLKNG